MFKNLKISAKMLTGFFIIILMAIVMMVFAISNLQKVGKLTNDLYQKPFTVSTNSVMIQRDLHSMAREMRGMCLFEDTDPKTYMDNVNKTSENAKNSLATVEKLFLGDATLCANITSGFDKLMPLADRVYQLVLDNDYKEAKRLLDVEYKPLFLDMAKNAQAIVDYASTTAGEFNNNASKTLTNSTIILIAISVAMVIISIIVSIFIARMINRPIVQITNAANKMAAGDLDIDIQYQSKDEIGVLSEVFLKMSSYLRTVIRDINMQLSAMASNDFTTKSDVTYIGEYSALLEAMRNIQHSLTDTLLQINQSADQVSSGSDQVSSGAQALSQGATEQASSVEELAATVSEISSQVKANAQNANSAKVIVNHTGDELTASNSKMQQLITAMSEISTSSQEIGKVIKTIEDIAFQTNILALNAAVEAARAGAAGKGFAVVADEVRNLASKSAEAAKGTTALIEGSVKSVENGTALADDTAKSLVSVVESANEVIKMVDQISEDSSQQAQTISQVTQGIDQISSVVQTNSATAEESAAASEELSGQAQMLKGLVGQFKLNDSSSNFR